MLGLAQFEYPRGAGPDVNDGDPGRSAEWEAVLHRNLYRCLRRIGLLGVGDDLRGDCR